MWLTSVGERLSLFYGDDLSVKVPQENYPRLYKLLSGLWPHADVDHIIVDQKTGRLASFQLQYKADMSVSSLAAESLIKAAVSNCNGPDTR
jgi:hypothetical protein